MNKMQDKRKDHRWDCLVPVDGKEGTPFDKIRTVDFSKGGFGFISQSKIPVNKKITIEIDLTPDGEPAFVVGKVKWVRPIEGTDNYKIGVSFDEVLRGSKGRLKEYFKETQE